MENVEIMVDGTKLHLLVDLSKDFGLSKSGKTITVGSTNGFQKLPGQPDLIVNLNVARKP